MAQRVNKALENAEIRRLELEVIDNIFNIILKYF